MTMLKFAKVTLKDSTGFHPFWSVQFLTAVNVDTCIHSVQAMCIRS